MTPKELLWKWVLDPIIRVIERRLSHYQSLRAVTHDGASWSSIAQIGSSCVFYEDASLINVSKRPEALVIHQFCHVRGQITVHAGAHFSLGTHCFVGQGSRIWTRSSVSIGNHVLISHDVDIHDTDSHSLHWKLRRNEGVDLFENLDDRLSPHVKHKPVIIEDDVWIGFKSTILKGVTVGRGAIVAAGSVVTKDVPPFTLVAGNPARVVRELES